MSIILKDVSYVYMPKTPYERVALKNISLTINEGEFIGLVGHTGSGKSSLAQQMNGLLKPSGGEVIVDETDINIKGRAARLARRKVGMVFQYPEHQIFEETVYDDIAFGPRNLELKPEEIERRVLKAMNAAGLDKDAYSKRSPFQLSGGEMRKVAIAGVIALEPKYLILDEPSAGLDSRGQREIFEEIVKLHRAAGITVILISHNMEEISRLVNRLIVLKKGRVILDGLPGEIFASHQQELNDAGVDIPKLSSFLHKLKNRGLDVDTKILAIDEAVKNILEALKRKTYAD